MASTGRLHLLWILYQRLLVWLKIIAESMKKLRMKLLRDNDVSVGLLPPGNMGFPCIGETIQFLLKGHTGQFFVERHSKYGSIFRTNFLGMNVIHVSDVRYVRKILLEEHRLVTVFWPPAMMKLLGNGALSTSAEAAHRCIRKQTRPAMTGEAVKGYIPVMVECITTEFEKWQYKREIDVYNCTKFLTMKMACAVLLGPVDLDDGVVEELASDFLKFGDGFFQLPLPIPGSTFSKALAAKHRIIANLNLLCKSGTKALSIFKSIFEDYENYGFSDGDERTNLAIEILFGAQETTACTITCVMYLLDKYPHALYRLQTEIEHHISTSGGNGDDDGLCWTGLDKISSLLYLNSVMKETLRMFPPIGGGYRKVLETFEIGGYTVPKDWTLTYSINDMQAKGNADEGFGFDPDRWNAEPDSPLHNDYYLPFGAGARLCIGRDYATLFVKLAIISLATQYSWKLISEEPRFTRVPIVRPQKPMMASFCRKV